MMLHMPTPPRPPMPMPTPIPMPKRPIPPIAKPTLLASVLLSAAFALATPALSTAAGVALVADVVGDAQYDRAPVKLLAELPNDAELTLKPGAQIVLFYVDDGAQWTIRGPGQFRLRAGAPVPQKGAAPAVQKAASPEYRQLRLRGERLNQGGVVMRGRALVAPVHEVVMTPSVEFVWERFGDGITYQLELVDSAGTRLFNAETQATEITLPSSVALLPGQEYFWSIRGRDAGATQSFYRAADFRVADTATRERLQSVKPADDAPFADRALYVALLDDAGMRSMAQALRRTLAIERPVGWAPLR